MQKLKRAAQILLVLLGLTAIAAVVPIRTVTDDAMSWTLRPGDWIWVLPADIRPADIVVVRDPLDPHRTVLRRVVGVPGKKIRYEDNTLRITGKRIRQTDMGKRDGHRVFKEVIWSTPPARPNPYYITLLLESTQWETEDKLEVPEGHYYLAADNRDGAVDSRWWGAVPKSAIQGVVRARLAAEPDDWRTRFELMLPEV